ATPLTDTLSLHDALPISELLEHAPHALAARPALVAHPVPGKEILDEAHGPEEVHVQHQLVEPVADEDVLDGDEAQYLPGGDHLRSEEHTSELQSRETLVC